MIQIACSKLPSPHQRTGLISAVLIQFSTRCTFSSKLKTSIVTPTDDITYKDWLKRNNITPTDPVADIHVDYSLPSAFDGKTHAKIPNPYRPVELLTLDEVKETLNAKNTLSFGSDLNLDGEETLLQSSDGLDTTATDNISIEHTIEYDAEERRLKVKKPE
ncbi:unnamed protein product [Ambrosiozyma monospora]|uniref:Unnamed protein product n=1 Tax=Ambrosiozyma monospora TaxID=43982 RepID=A0A9W7DIA0_AMBMO|nr:unnamed protein product [Ambrosiozyma monospora]